MSFLMRRHREVGGTSPYPYMPVKKPSVSIKKLKEEDLRCHGCNSKNLTDDPRFYNPDHPRKLNKLCDCGRVSLFIRTSVSGRKPRR